ncbi:restriction endonuclease subunit S [Parathalassolituus penaei]|uniref:Restriction endonuclease subunit S n=1 Tax=Parathalassolituus penaei TaxID=2997323 RepID=A0A9X3ECE3_9GAMM|nr:restriction endonuclease subunit S [Parathalassolituus penaei]MCY0964541.1 restriction endonuclease subunit S [Parathalassolituus penaei]
MNPGIADRSVGYQTLENNGAATPALETANDCPKGYKRTEVGVIPEDWDVQKFGDICLLINGRGFKPYEWGIEGLPIIRIQNLNGSDEYNYYQGIYDSKIFIKTGQLLFAWSGSRGTSFGPHVWKGGDALLNYHTWKLVVRNESIDEQYFFHILKDLTKRIEEAAHGASALVHTQKGEMENFYVPFPPKKEQTAIANALSDIDALISELDTLIAKKQAIKTATMQQLLTGRTRLPTFAKREDGTDKGYKPSELGEIPEDWEVIPLGKIAIIERGKFTARPRNDPKYFGGSIPFIQTGDISRSNGWEVSYSQTLNKDGVEVSRLFPGNSLYFTIAANIGDVAVVKFEAACPDSLVVLSEYNDFCKIWLFYALSREKGNFESLATSNAQSNLNLEKLNPYLIAVPPLNEQTAIANILSDMDTEITALQQRQQKTRQIKQGMMQELLTGRTRLL